MKWIAVLALLSHLCLSALSLGHEWKHAVCESDVHAGVCDSLRIPLEREPAGCGSSGACEVGRRCVDGGHAHDHGQGHTHGHEHGHGHCHITHAHPSLSLLPPRQSDASPAPPPVASLREAHWFEANVRPARSSIPATARRASAGVGVPIRILHGSFLI